MTRGSRGPERAVDDDVAKGWTLATGAADLDGDLRPELYFANDFGPDRLLVNRSTPGHVRLTEVDGKRNLTTPASKVLGHDSFKGMGVDFGDLDDDGRLDIVVSNIAAPFALQESNFAFLRTGGAARPRPACPVHDESERLGLARSGWAWDVKLGDFDNDGSQEIVQATGFVRGTANRWPELHELAIGNDDAAALPAAPGRASGPATTSAAASTNAFYARGARASASSTSGSRLGVGDKRVTRGHRDGRRRWRRPPGLRDGEPMGALAPVHATDRLGPDLPGARPADRRRAGDAGPTRRPFPARAAGRRPAVGAIAERDAARRPAARRSGRRRQRPCQRARAASCTSGSGSAPRQPIMVRISWRTTRGAVRTEQLSLRPGWHTIVLNAR